MTEPEKDSQAKPGLTFGQRIRGYILTPHLSPKRIALSFAIGLSIAMSPLIGLQIWIGLACCYCAKGLHRPLLLAATFLNNPWTFAPLASMNLFLGNLILRRGWAANLSKEAWEGVGLNCFLTKEGLVELAATIKPMLAPFLIGGFSLSVLSIFIGYWLMLRISIRVRREAN